MTTTIVSLFTGFFTFFIYIHTLPHLSFHPPSHFLSLHFASSLQINQPYISTQSNLTTSYNYLSNCPNCLLGSFNTCCPF
ncbi:hypothetical protein L6452_33255 [Arctium lappa]|uniref:Uncharacterized protein n=1 Tax=Arctium lappa TaxID=4217 RepID=A0ACB8Z805_ARCLA|nr:hypothetical protein L6452_33255 [Arctium lappa]